ncbi:Fungal specific transcription factor domain containing protein [Hyaloscypha variabilis]
MRVSTACQACRSRRRKCDAAQFGVSCTYCSERGIQCTRDSSFNSQSTSPAPSVPVVTSILSRTTPIKVAAQSSDSFPSPSICLELVNLYFDFIHDQFHSLFHKPSFVEDVTRGQASPVILLAMMALSARFSSNPFFSNINPRQRGDRYAEESNRLLNLREVSLTTAQACVLLGAFSITHGEAHAEAVYYSVACRIANLLDLANKTTSDPIEREVNVRVWWSLCMIDVWSSTGVGLPRQMPILDNLPLPMDDVTFLALRPGNTLPWDIENGALLLAQMIKLNRILLEINLLNERTVSGTTSGVVLENEVMSLSNALDEWHNSLPTSMHDTPANLHRYASQGLGRMFVAVYLGYYHFGQLLFYQFLHGDCTGTVLSARFYADRCKAYAESLCEIIYAANAISDCDVRYTMVGHIMVIASTVQIHTLLFSDNSTQIAAARRRLERNFEILSQLRTYWPTLDICFTRLQAFHKACRSSMDESFRLDQWMLRFLSEFAQPVDDRILDRSATEVWSLDNIGCSPET